MSRHRYVKNLNISDELDDDALDDEVDDEEEMTVEEQLKMNDVLEEIRKIIGEEEISGLPDTEIKDTIWYYHFDLSESLQWCLDEQEKRHAARERQVMDKSLPPIPEGRQQHHYSGMDKYGGYPGDTGISGRSRMPLIHLAQQQAQMMEQRHRQAQWEEGQKQMYQEMQMEQEYDDDVPQQILLEEATEEDIQNNTMDLQSSRRLSTITEISERTEFVPPRPPYHPDYLPSTARSSSSFTDSTYGNLIDAGYLVNPEHLPLDPNLIPVSPSGSAVHRLSTYEPAPSLSSGSYPASSPPRPPSEPVPPLDTIPDIPDTQSTAAANTAPPSLPPKSPPPVRQGQESSSSSAPTHQAVKQSSSINPKPLSKLAQLANTRSKGSRATASTGTRSSADLGTVAADSIKTYPVLRPDSHYPVASSSVSSSSSSAALPVLPPSQRPGSEISSISSSSAALPVPPPGQRPGSEASFISSSSSSASTVTPIPSPRRVRRPSQDTPAASTPSATSSEVRKAIESALELEAIDRELAASRQARRTPTVKKMPTESSKASIPSQVLTPTEPNTSSRPSPTSSRPSKVVAEAPASPSPTSPQSARQPSKLALLAQAKAQKAAENQKAIASVPKTPAAFAARAKPPPPNQLPPEHTEYLTPIANGPTVTTAITTSYHTLYSLTDPNKPTAYEAPFVVPLPAPKYIKSSSTESVKAILPGSASPPSKPPSKLAMKVKKAQQEKYNSVASPTTGGNETEEDDKLAVVIVPPIFLPRSTSRSSASPSAFASVLIDDLITNSPQANESSLGHRKSTKGKEKATSVISSEGQSKYGSPPERQRSRRIAPSLGTPTTASSHAFDGPSPDDIVFNARRGTALAVDGNNNVRRSGSTSTPSRSATRKSHSSSKD